MLYWHIEYWIYFIFNIFDIEYISDIFQVVKSKSGGMYISLILSDSWRFPWYTCYIDILNIEYISYSIYLILNIFQIYFKMSSQKVEVCIFLWYCLIHEDFKFLILTVSFQRNFFKFYIMRVIVGTKMCFYFQKNCSCQYAIFRLKLTPPTLDIPFQVIEANMQSMQWLYKEDLTIFYAFFFDLQLTIKSQKFCIQKPWKLRAKEFIL